MIHPSAIVEDGAQLGVDCEILARAIVTRHAVLADRVVVHPGAVVGGDPQYIKFDRATPSFVRVGEGTVIRENVTLNRAIHAGNSTVIGARCFLMANSHLGHDCALGDDVVLANNVMLAGHVDVGSFTFIGGGAGIHQFCRIGESAMISGLSRISRDLAPFTITAERDEVSGLNLVGLKRRGFSREAIGELKTAFRAVYFGLGNIRELAATALANGNYTTTEARRFLEFFAGGKRGFARSARTTTEASDA
ncbi:acyl-ACP--UDP-N-acetylglucosamine O-acyltransferase [Rariglobus hedericola]|uniref:Acyl-ACP--UDP-N-acetylglucosamine O-acyltransferase n=1 Tax=Rariglobus hedericola TaxID=2597822 RepID=A0A556QLN0_9BACT|nr:acyl-ACP--UDP-N-acetylglucosamine O-acyltransferase [Rariglobus hedericola]